MLAPEHLPAFLMTTAVQGLPALIALIAWGEGGRRILRQYGARMMWELCPLVAVGVAFLLYATLRLMSDDGANATIIIAGALSSVPAVTVVTQRVQVASSPLRLTLAAGVSFVALEAGLLLGLVMATRIWTSTP